MPRRQWILFLGLLSGCSCGGPKAGDPCQNITCGDSKTMLRCDTGAYEPLKCPGPTGCTETRDASDNLLIICDLAGTVAGDPCTTGMTGFVLCQSSTNALVCNSAAFAETTCTTPCITSQPDGTGGACN